MIKENDVRKGFFEDREYLALHTALLPYLKPFVAFACKFGWRAREIADLTWNQVYRVKGIVTLEAGETKKDDARTVYLGDTLKDTFNQLWKDRTRNGRTTYSLSKSRHLSRFSKILLIFTKEHLKSTNFRQ